MNKNTKLVLAGAAIAGGAIYYFTKDVVADEPNDGDLRCNGYNLEEYQGGVWVVAEDNSFDCDYIEPEPDLEPEPEPSPPSMEVIFNKMTFTYINQDMWMGYYDFVPLGGVYGSNWTVYCGSSDKYKVVTIKCKAIYPSGGIKNIAVTSNTVRGVHLAYIGLPNSSGYRGDITFEFTAISDGVVVGEGILTYPSYRPDDIRTTLWSKPPSPAKIESLYFYKLIEGVWDANIENITTYMDLVIGLENKVNLNLSQFSCDKDRKIDIVAEIISPSGAVINVDKTINVSAGKSGAVLVPLGLITEGAYYFNMQIYDNASGIMLDERNFIEVPIGI